MRTRFMPLFKAAAMIAVLFLMGTVMQHTMEGGDSDTVSVHDEYQNSTTDPKWHTNLYCLQIRWQRLPLMIPVQGNKLEHFHLLLYKYDS